MKKRSLKKLELNQTIVSKLDDKENDSIKGGLDTNTQKEHD
ncbi:hypothetical protein [Kordia aestuariivivens]|nr:hypothetical protein [Kordia aestuariivivens]